VASARSVYTALTELASDSGREDFSETKALIAHKAGVSIKTAERVLNGLEELGLVTIERSLVNAGSGAIRAPNRYTLCAIRHHDAASMRHQQSSSVSDKVEERERHRKKVKGSQPRADIPLKPLTPYPMTEEEMAIVLESLGIEFNPDYDGNFFEQGHSILLLGLGSFHSSNDVGGLFGFTFYGEQR